MTDFNDTLNGHHERGYKAVDGARIPGGGAMVFANETRAIAQGCEAVAALLWRDREAIHAEVGETPLKCLEADALLGLLRANMRMLADRADEFQEWAFEYHADEGTNRVLERAKNPLRTQNTTEKTPWENA